MEINDEEIKRAVRETEVLRFPRQTLATFGTTAINYYLLTTPIYDEEKKSVETVIREGKVSAERPRIITPSFLSRLEGFSENARRYLDMVIRYYGPNAAGLLYSYKNESKELTIVSETLETVAGRLKEDIDKAGDKLSAIVKGVDHLWDVSLLKFISEITEGSIRANIDELDRKGLLHIDRAGIPREARIRIEELFEKVSRGELDPSELKRELDRWDLFEEYEDRFLNLFRKK